VIMPHWSKQSISTAGALRWFIAFFSASIPSHVISTMRSKLSMGLSKNFASPRRPSISRRPSACAKITGRSPTAEAGTQLPKACSGETRQRNPHSATFHTV
jgi:hypothetical protein